MVEAVIAFGGGCGRTVSPLPTFPLHPRLPILLPHALFPGQFTLSPRDLVCWLLTHRLWVILVSRRHFLGLHELLKHPRTVIRVLLMFCSSTGKIGVVFSSRRASTAVHPHAEGFPPIFHLHAWYFAGFIHAVFPWANCE